MPHILIVEDNLDDVDILTTALHQSHKSLTLSWVPNTVTALAYLSKQGLYDMAQTPDVIIVDLNLPIQSGRILLQEISHDHVWKGPRVIVLSGSRQAGDI